MITRAQLREALVKSEILFETSDGVMYTALRDGDVADGNVDGLYDCILDAFRIASIKEMLKDIDNPNLVSFLIKNGFDPNNSSRY